MLYQPSFASPASPQRRGVVLLVVITLLTIFAVAGVAFVYYSDSEATASRTYREAAVYQEPDMESELLFAYFLQQLIFGVNDDESGVYSALRGHELLRNLLGPPYLINPPAPIPEAQFLAAPGT